MFVQDEVSDAEKFAKDQGIPLRQGRWAPDAGMVAQRQAQFRKANEEQSNMMGKLAGVIAIFITMMIVVSVIPMEASCLFSLIMFFTFGIVVAMVMILSNRVKPAPYVDWQERYPLIEVNRTAIHFNGKEIDFSKIGGVEVDRYHNEFLLIETNLARRAVPLDVYPNMTEMVLALQGAFEANGVRVTDRYPEWNGPSQIKPIRADGTGTAPRTVAPEDDGEDEEDGQDEEFFVTAIEEGPKERPVVPAPSVPKPAERPTTVPTVTAPQPKGQVCSKCGSPLNDDLIECPNCGSAI